nr:hypothetical protein [Tanacetum cinerariifolium]
MVDFIAASPLRYALTVKPTISVSHIRQFWSTARIETTDEGTHVLATVDGIQRTISKSSLRRNLKLRDEDGIVSIPDTELFENLTLMGYALTIKPTVFVSQIRHFWSTARIKTTDEGTHILATIDGIQSTVSEASLRRNLKLRDEDGIVSIPDTELFENLTLMGTKSIGFNEFTSNIATALVCLATNRTYNFSKMIFDGMVKNVNNKGEGSGTPTEPHHTPSLKVTSSHPSTSSIPLPSIPTALI